MIVRRSSSEALANYRDTEDERIGELFGMNIGSCGKASSVNTIYVSFARAPGFRIRPPPRLESPDSKVRGHLSRLSHSRDVLVRFQPAPSGITAALSAGLQIALLIALTPARLDTRPGLRRVYLAPAIAFGPTQVKPSRRVSPGKGDDSPQAFARDTAELSNLTQTCEAVLKPRRGFQ
jgi:hypothetical protein